MPYRRNAHKSASIPRVLSDASHLQGTLRPLLILSKASHHFYSLDLAQRSLRFLQISHPMPQISYKRLLTSTTTQGRLQLNSSITCGSTIRYNDLLYTFSLLFLWDIARCDSSVEQFTIYTCIVIAQLTVFGPYLLTSRVH